MKKMSINVFSWEIEIRGKIWHTKTRKALAIIKGQSVHGLWRNASCRGFEWIPFIMGRKLTQDFMFLSIFLVFVNFNDKK